eukprot:210418-Prymnesium_polylepis.1
MQPRPVYVHAVARAVSAEQSFVDSPSRRCLGAGRALESPPAGAPPHAMRAGRVASGRASTARQRIRPQDKIRCRTPHRRQGLKP